MKIHGKPNIMATVILVGLNQSPETIALKQISIEPPTEQLQHEAYSNLENTRKFAESSKIRI